MENPYKFEEEHIESLLDRNEPIQVFDYIIGLLKEEKKDDVNLKLLSISYLNHIANEYFIRRREEKNFLKVAGKSEELINKLKKCRADVSNEILLNFEASLQQSKFKFKLLKGENYAEILEKYLQHAISNYWRSLRICKRENEKYNIRNNLANCLVLAGRFIEAISLFNKNINQTPNRFQSLASLGHAMENLKRESILPEIPSFYFVVAERYFNAKDVAPSNHVKESIEKDIERCRLRLEAMKLELNENNLHQNRDQEQKEFQDFSPYRKYVLNNELSLNEHALHCHCSNSEHDSLSIGLYSGSTHRINPEKLNKLEKYLNRIKSEFVFARLLFYKYETFDNVDDSFYSEDDYKNTAIHNNDDILGYRVEHLRTSYRILYGLLDKIASAILVHFNIPENGKCVYFEDVFNHFKNDLSNKENIHLHALHSMSLDLSQSTDGIKVGSLGFYKKIRNALEHELLILSENETDMDKKELNISDFTSFIFELMKLTKSAIFSLNYLIRTDTFVEE
jgi:tetratricopeptide (TPR) repeat protein